eukprot:TRINITY_DN80111_c0_g1_i1.p1 TRINITY_DN80111_c0_g1~~TRINITY_DN80111_c0_g1_i1.p1  ORF type:complete len:120 (-),score=2.39 TRINITY_DN80111_c0_g1_i1:215-574(-)
MASLAFVTVPTAPCGLRRSAAFSQAVKSSVSIRAAPVRSLKIVASSQPDLDDKIAQKIEEAKETCASGSGAECAVAWDEVEEMSAARSHTESRAKESSDPLEQYCDENPDADECRIYSD